MELFPEVARLLKVQQAEDILLIGGGVIPENDIPELKLKGIAEVFTPGSAISEMASYIRTHAKLNSHQDFAELTPLASKVDHLGIAVAKITDALSFYQGVLGLGVLHEEEIADQQVRVAFLALGDTHIELLEPTSEDSPIAKFLAKHGPGLHHVAYAVEDVVEALAKAKNAGFRLIDEQPRAGGQGKQIAFLHPKDTTGVLTEFCQHLHSGRDGGAV